MNSPLLPQRNNVVGEPYVWFTAMGLTVGLAMVALLLGMILVNGLKVFWPKRVELATLKEGSTAGLKGGNQILGELAKRQEKRSVGGRGLYELQYFTGNRDVYDASFKYVDESEIVSRTLPHDILAIERVEYGDALGTPVRLQPKGSEAIPASDSRFGSRLQALTKEAAARRQAIYSIEKNEIGAVNRQMTAIQLRRKRSETAGDTAQLAAYDAQLAAQQATYEELAAKAKELRARQFDDLLVLRLPTGEERILPLGQVIDNYWPNQLGFTQRFARFTHNVWSFLSENPREANTEGGIFPAIFGTFVMTLLMSAAVVPLGVIAAIYLREYAKQGFFVRCVRIAVNNLAGVPSIVFGVFGLGFFVYFVGGGLDALFYPEYAPTPVFGTGGILWASATLALMTVPVVIVATEEAIAAVPRGMKEGSLATGASKWQTIQRIVLPASAPGILTGLILAMARGAGEVAPLMLVGVVKLAPTLPLDTIWKDTDLVPFVHLDQKFMHLGFHIFDLGFQSPDSEAAKPMVFATTLFLILLVVCLNLGAILLRERLRRKFKLGAF